MQVNYQRFQNDYPVAVRATDLMSPSEEQSTLKPNRRHKKDQKTGEKKNKAYYAKRTSDRSPHMSSSSNYDNSPTINDDTNSPPDLKILQYASNSHAVADILRLNVPSIGEVTKEESALTPLDELMQAQKWFTGESQRLAQRTRLCIEYAHALTELNKALYKLHRLRNLPCDQLMLGGINGIMMVEEERRLHQASIEWFAVTKRLRGQWIAGSL